MPAWGVVIGTILLSSLVAAPPLHPQDHVPVKALDRDGGPLAGRAEPRASCLRTLAMPRKPRTSWQIGPGVRASTWQWNAPSGRAPQVRVSVVAAQPGSAIMRPVGRIPTMTDPERIAGHRTSLAVINGDFFDTLPRGDALPHGALIVGGKPVFVPSGWSRVVAWNTKGRLRASHVSLDARITSPSQSWSIAALNDPFVRGEQIAIVTSDWHRTFVPDGLSALVVKEHVVRARHDKTRSVRVPRDGYVLVAKATEALPALAEGDRVGLELAVTTSNHQEIVHAAGHGGVALRDGHVQPMCSPYESIPRPRSMLAWDEDGRVWLLTASSGLPDTPDGLRRGGMTKEELARVARRVGATMAVIMDGGGSTALFARRGSTAKRLDMSHGSWVRPVPIAWQLTAP